MLQFQSASHSFKTAAMFALVTASVLATSNRRVDAQQQTLKDQIKFTAEYQIETGADIGVLLLTVDITDGNYIYALEQSAETIRPSKISVEESTAFSIDKFVPSKKPIVIKNDPVFRCDVAKHKGKVVFWAPIKLAANQTAENVEIEMAFNGSVCAEKNGMCFPIRNKPVRVAFGGYYDKKEQNKR